MQSHSSEKNMRLQRFFSSVGFFIMLRWGYLDNMEGVNLVVEFPVKYSFPARQFFFKFYSYNLNSGHPKTTILCLILEW